MPRRSSGYAPKEHITSAVYARLIPVEGTTRRDEYWADPATGELYTRRAREWARRFGATNEQYAIIQRTIRAGWLPDEARALVHLPPLSPHAPVAQLSRMLTGFQHVAHKRTGRRPTRSAVLAPGSSFWDAIEEITTSTATGARSRKARALVAVGYRDASFMGRIGDSGKARRRS